MSAEAIRGSVRRMTASVVVITFTSAAVVAGAMAATPSVSSTFSGKSKRDRFVLTIQPLCGTPGCHQATAVRMGVSAGHPNKKCNSAYQLSDTKLKRGGKFKTSGQFQGPGKIYTFTISGTFVTAKKVIGNITGPAACGGQDKYTLVAQ